EELTPGYRTISIQALGAEHLRFGPEVKGCVRIDQEQRMVRRRVRRSDCDTIRTAGLRICRPLLCQCLPHGSLSVKRLELIEIDLFNVPADAAFRESKGHPGLELRDHARRHL